MSGTLKTSNLQHKDSADPNIQLYADGSTSIRNLQNLANNVIINGACQVTQRGEVLDITASTAHNLRYGGADRFKLDIANNAYRAGVSAVTTPAGGALNEGFRKCHQVQNSNAVASAPSNGICHITYRLEGQNLQQFCKGIAAAKKYSISFWARSSVAGTYNLEMVDRSSPNRQITHQYTLAANTWTFVSHTFNGDTSGNYPNNSDLALEILWWLSAGSDYTTGSTSDDWREMTPANRAPGQVNWASAVNNVFQLTGVQLTATDAPIAFQHEDYGTTLLKCQRYYQRVGTTVEYVMPRAGTNITITIPFNVPMRAYADITNYALHPRGNGTEVTSAEATNSNIHVLWKTESTTNAGFRDTGNLAKAGIAYEASAEL